MLTLLVQYTWPRVTMWRFSVENKHLLWQFDIKKTTHCDNLLHRRYLVPKIIPYVIYCVCLFVCLFDGVYHHFQQYFSYIVEVSFIGGWNRRTLRKSPTCRVTDKLYHIMLYTSPCSRFELTTSAVIGTDCIGSCKSNYHTITDTTAPFFSCYWCHTCDHLWPCDDLLWVEIKHHLWQFDIEKTTQRDNLLHRRYIL